MAGSSDLMPVWFYVLGGCLFLLGMADLLWSAWRAPVVLYPSRILTRLTFPSPTQEVRFETLRAWAHTKHLVGFAATASPHTYVALARLRRRDRRRLLHDLRALLGEPGGNRLLMEDLERRERRMRVTMIGMGIAIAVLTLVVVLVLL